MTSPAPERGVVLPAEAPLRPVRLAPAACRVERRPDGAILIRSPRPLEPYAEKLGDRLDHWAGAAPDRVFLAERDAAGAWRTLTYADARARVRRIA